MTDRTVPERREVKAALRAAGLSNRQADALLRSGWRGLVDASEAEAAELRDQLAALKASMGAGLAKHANSK
jgi:hypothetical protein